MCPSAYIIRKRSAIPICAPNGRAIARVEEVAGVTPTVATDFALGLVTVACPCGVSVGILPGSTAWHLPCHARMEPVDPGAASRLLKRARERRSYRARTPSERMEIRAKNPASRAVGGGGEAQHSLAHEQGAQP